MPNRLSLVSRKARVRFFTVGAGLLVTGAIGYVGFTTFVTAQPLLGAGLLALAAGTGFAAFFSPCSFPLLLTFLARGAASSPRKAVASGLRVAAGAGILLAIVALLTAFGSTAIGEFVRFDSTAGRIFRAGVAAFLIVMGLTQLQIIPRAKWAEAIANRASKLLQATTERKGATGDIAYGFAYLLMGFG